MQVRHGDVAVDHHAFELIEGVLVGGVHALVAEDAAGRDHAQRRAQPLHAAHLHRRGVGAQQVAAFQPEGVLHVARGVVGRNVEGVEIVILGFHFGAVQHGEAERGEQLFELALDAGDGMQMAAARAGRGQREVEPFGVEPGVQGRLRRIRAAGLRAPASIFCLAALSSLPMRVRSSGASLPISLPTCASAPLRPSASTRTSSSSPAEAAAGDARERTGL